LAPITISVSGETFQSQTNTEKILYKDKELKIVYNKESLGTDIGTDEQQLHKISH